MIKLKYIDPRNLKQLLEPLDYSQIFYTGFLLGGCKIHNLQALKITVKTVSALTNLLNNQLINLNQRNNILQMCLQLDLEKMSQFTRDINCIAQNRDITDIIEAIKVNFERLMITQQRKIIRHKVQAKTKSSDTIIIDQSQKEEQLRIMQALKRQKQQQAYSLQIAKKMLEQQQQQLKRGRPDDTAQCNICFTQLYQQQYVPLDCGHVFHKACIQASLKNQIQQKKFPLICPDAQCGQQLIDNQAKGILKQLDFEKYQKFSLAAYVDLHGDQFSWCPTADCGYVFFYQQGQNQFHCQICKKDYCLKCRVEWHKNMNCQQFQATRDPQKRDQKFQDFVKGSKFKQCPKCKFWVAKDVGCDSMTCRCGAFFCYKCGKQQAYSHGPCQCNNGAGQFGNMFARPAVAVRNVINQRRQNNRRKRKK